MRDQYLKALKDFEELLDNAVANGGGIDAGNGKFIPNAHWDFELRDQLNSLRESYIEATIQNAEERAALHI